MRPDQSPHIEALLAEQSWLGGLARQLTRDPSAAADLAQDTWAAALENPPRELGVARAWLRTVAGRLARRSYHGEAARAIREREAGRSEAVSDTTEAVVRAELLGKLVEATLMLEEPFRETVLLRYFQDKAPREIAQLMDVPASTVRSRLTRAHLKLRTELGGFEERREHFGMGFFAGVGELLGKASVLMNANKVAAVCGLVLFTVGGVALFLEGSGAASRGLGKEEARLEREEIAALPASSGLQQDPSGGNDRTPAVAPVIAGEMERIVGSIVDPDGHPIEGASIRLVLGADRESGTPALLETRSGAGVSPRLLASTASDPAGWFEFDPRELKLEREGGIRLRVTAVAAGFLDVDEAILNGQPLSLRPDWRNAVEGIVREAGTGQPIVGAAVYIDPDGAKAFTDSRGHFRYADVNGYMGMQLQLHHVDHAFGLHSIDVVGEGTTRVELEMQRGRRLDLRFVDSESGAFVPRTALFFDSEGYASVRADASGELSLRVDGSERQHLFGEADGYAYFQWSFDPEEVTDEGWIEVPMEAVVHVRGTPVNAAGELVPGYTVRGYPSEMSHARAHAGLPGTLWHTQSKQHGWDASIGSAVTDAEGRFAVPLVESEGPWSLRVKTRTEKAEAPVASIAEEVELVLSSEWKAGTVGGTILRGGEAWDQRIGLGLEGAARRFEWDLDEGHFEFVRLPEGEYRLSLGGRLLREFRIERDHPVVDLGTIEIDDVFRVDFLCLAADGSPLSDCRLSLNCAEPEVLASLVPAVGAFRSMVQTDHEGRAVLLVPFAGRHRLTVTDKRLVHEEIVTIEASGSFTITASKARVLTIRLLDEETGDPIELTDFSEFMFGWRLPGDASTRLVRGERQPDGTMRVALPDHPVELSVRGIVNGYQRKLLSAAELEGLVPQGTLEIRLRRGYPFEIRIGERMDEVLEVSRELELFLVHETDLELVHGRLEASEALRLKGLGRSTLFVDEALRLQQIWFQSASNVSRFEGLRAGTYTIVAFDEDGARTELPLQPDSFPVGPAADSVELRPRP